MRTLSHCANKTSAKNDRVESTKKTPYDTPSNANGNNGNIPNCHTAKKCDIIDSTKHLKDVPTSKVHNSTISIRCSKNGNVPNRYTSKSGPIKINTHNTIPHKGL